MLARLDDYAANLDAIADLLRELVLQTPPNVVEGSWRSALPELLNAARLGGRLRKLDMQHRRELLALFSTSGGDYLDGWFESDPIKALYGFDGIVGNYASPYTPGSAYVLLHHVFGEVNGNKGAWGHAIGGMGAITQAMAKCAQSRGVEIELKQPGSGSARRERARGRCGDGTRRRSSGRRGHFEPESEAAVSESSLHRACCRMSFGSRLHGGAAGLGRSA